MIKATYKTSLVTLIKNEIAYVALAKDYDKPNTTTQISAVNELTRISVTPAINGNVITIPVTIPANRNPSSTTIATVNSQKEFIVSSITGFSVGDFIVINYGSNISFSEQVYAKISNISGSAITIEKSSEVTLTVGMTVIGVITQAHIVKGGSSVANTGTTIMIIPLSLIKESPNEISFNLVMEGIGS